MLLVDTFHPRVRREDYYLYCVYARVCVGRGERVPCVYFWRAIKKKRNPDPTTQETVKKGGPKKTPRKRQKSRRKCVCERELFRV